MSSLAENIQIEIHQPPTGYMWRVKCPKHGPSAKPFALRACACQEFIGVQVEVRVGSEIKLRIMCRWMLLSSDNTIYVDCQPGVGISEELRIKVGGVAQKAIVEEMSALERRAAIDEAKREGRFSS